MKYLWQNKCEEPENYHCKCKVCKSAYDHAFHLQDVEVIESIHNNKWQKQISKINKGLKHNSKPLPDYLIKECV